MGNVKDIIEELTDNSKSLSSPLLKTKVLAHRLDTEQLKNWVEKELNGYKAEDDDLPDYRVLTPELECTLQKGWDIKRNTAVPIMLFSEKWRQVLTGFHVFEGVASLESKANGESGDTLMKRYGEDFSAMLTNQIAKKDPELIIADISSAVHISQLKGVIESIRSKLLDFMLALEKEVPELSEEENIKDDKKDKVAELFNRTIINVTGDGNIVTSGNENTITTTNLVQKGNLDSLKRALIESNVSEEDASELVEIVQEEIPDETGDLGQKTKGWIGKMIQKSLDGSWQIGIAMAGRLLYDLIKSYHGA